MSVDPDEAQTEVTGRRLSTQSDLRIAQNKHAAKVRERTRLASARLVRNRLIQCTRRMLAKARPVGDLSSPTPGSPTAQTESGGLAPVAPASQATPGQTHSRSMSNRECCLVLRRLGAGAIAERARASLRTSPTRLPGNVHQPRGDSQIRPGTKNARQVTATATRRQRISCLLGAHPIVLGIVLKFTEPKFLHQRGHIHGKAPAQAFL